MSPRTISLTIALLLTAGVALAQPEVEWERTYDNYSGSAFCSSFLKKEDGFILAGYGDLGEAEYRNAWLMSTDGEGNTDWLNTYGTDGLDGCYSLIQIADGNFVLAGALDRFDIHGVDGWLVGTNDVGDSLWSRTYGGRHTEYFSSCIQTTDGGFASVGSTSNDSAGQAGYRKFLLVYTDSNYDSLWSHVFGGDRDNLCHSIIETNDGGFALAGSTTSFGSGHYDFWLIKTDENGDSLWSFTFGGGDFDLCRSMIQTADGGFALAGTTNSFGVGGSDFWLMKTNSNGDSLWSRTYGGGGEDECFTILQTNDGGLVLGGSSTSFGVGNRDFWLLRSDINGDSLWSQTIGTRGDEQCYSALQTTDNGFAMAGYTQDLGPGNAAHIYLVKTTPDPVTVRNSDPVHPSSLILHPSFPNPFNSMVTIPFGLDKSAPTRLAIFDPLSRRIADVIPSQVMSAGSHSVVWNANAFPAGSYLVRLESGSQSLTQPIRLVK